MNIRYGVLVPTLNAGPSWPKWLEALSAQRPAPAEVLVIDSESVDNTATLARDLGFRVLEVERSSFNHGGTRHFGVSQLEDRIDVLVCLTQDALLADSNAIATLLLAFEDPSVGAAYGRQLPASDASPLAKHARIFNYPSHSRTVRPSDRFALGFKACFLSNSFAAYRMTDLQAVGGFPRHVILGEDTSVAAKLLLSGKSIHYEARAGVHHSHNYSLGEEFRRYFDTGVFHARASWMLDSFGGASGEGRRFVQSELRFLAHHSPWLIPSALIRTAAKFTGYRLGRLEHVLPTPIKRRMSMFKAFWNQSEANEPELGR